MLKSIITVLSLMVLSMALLLCFFTLVFGNYKDYSKGIDSYSCSSHNLSKDCLNISRSIK